MPRIRLFALSVGLVSIFACGPRERSAGAAGAAAGASAMSEGWWQKTQSRAGAWKEVEKLESEQKYEAAAAKVVEIREAAKKDNDEPNWTRALVEEVRLRRALGGFETAVRLLREQPWPKSAMASLVLEIVYADALTRYVHDYSWEIRRRERVDAKGAVDLKSWTADQIVAEARKSWQRVWARRAELGDESVAALGKIVNRNNYPDAVRGRLRDALSYLAVQTLADSTLWTPEESNELFRLDFDALLRGDAAAGQKVKLDDPAVHPMVKIAAVLDDLEDWERKKGRREAALEARLVHVEQLRAHFSKEAQRDATRAHVEQLLPAYRNTEWWAMGVARLAGWVRDDEGDNVRARKIALEGVAVWPRSLGGQACRALVASIEAPDFSMMGMTSDAPGKRSFEVTHKNLGKLWMRAYAVDLLPRIEAAKDYNLLPSYNEHDKLLGSGAKPAASWTVELPATPDYKHHRTFVTPPLKERGLYVIVASAREDFSQDKNRLGFANIVLTDLVMVARNDGAGGVELTVLHGSTGKAAKGAEVAMYRYDWQRGHRRVASRRVDDDGLARFPYTTGESQSHFFLALDENGKDVALESSSFYFSHPGTPRDVFQSLVYTDRAIYRPQQPLHYKVIAYRGRPDEARLRTAGGESLTVTLRDANNQVVGEQKVKTNDFGSASGTFQIPTGRLLGQWHLQTSAQGHAGVRVEEYKRPTFEVSFKDAKDALRLNKPATLVGEAKYYFGLPVTSGKVRWRVVRSAVYPWYWYAWGWYDGGGVGEQAIASGVSPLEADGTFKVAFTPVADESAGKDLSYNYHVEADLTDEGGETRSASRNVRLGFTSVEANIAVEGGFYLGGKAIDMKVARTNLDGAPRAGKGKFRLVALKPPSKAALPADLPRQPSELGYGRAGSKGKRNAPPALKTPGDELRPRWATAVENEMSRWAEGDDKGAGELTHDDKGQATAALGALTPGVYRLKYSTVDDFGATYETFRDFVVAGPKAPLPVAMLARLEQTSVKVGGTMRLYLTSGLADQELFLDVYRAGKRIGRRRVNAGETIVEWPIKDSDRGGFGLVVTGVRDHQMLSWQGSVFVPWDDRQLEVAFSSFRDTMRPGTKETFRVTVKAPNGRAADAGTAELLAYMYDRSLDTFAPHYAPSPMSLWPSRGGVPWAQTSLGSTYAQTRDRGWHDLPHGPSLHGDSLVVLSGYGIGGPGYGGGRARYRRGEEGAMMPMAAPAPSAPASEEAESKNGKDELARGDAAKADANAQVIADGRVAKVPAQATAGLTAGQQQGPAVRSNFAETAFFQPHLLLGKNGESAIEFTVPDSVTSWNVWVHAVTRDLSSGSVHKEARSVKELMVRPYVPRFFREGDQAELKVVVNNAGTEPMKGTVTIAVMDAETRRSEAAAFGLKELTREFTAEPGRGTNVTFPLAAPRRVGVYAFQVTAKAGAFSDGELRPLPVLPSRLHLVQSRFVTLRDGDKRTMTFEDLKKNDDPTRTDDQLVVTVDAQLFFTVLKALPYLVDYPYECTEQTLNRFVSTGIVTSLFDKYPSIAKMAADFAKARPTQLERFDAPDPNRKMALEESPWLTTAQGGAGLNEGAPIRRVLDPKIAQATREEAIGKLKKAQTSSGGFPWFPGGPPSPYMTLYILHGFAKAAEFKVAVPKEMVQGGWRYLADHVRREDLTYAMAHDCCWEFLTFVNYVAGAYPDETFTAGALTKEERLKILDFSFKHWKQHSPMLKGYLALTLKRMGREADAKLVWASVMDSAKTAQDQGTFWAPEDRSWLWYNDTIETHAFALRAQMELDPRNGKNDGLVLWLLLNKKLNQWKSTRATAEVLYSLAHYLEREHALGVREQATVSIGPMVNTLTFEPDRYVGKTQIVIPGPEVKPAEHNTITVEKKSKGVMFASATWHFSTDKLPSEERGDFFSVKRTYFRRDRDAKGAWVLTPLAEGAVLSPGDQLEVQVSLRTKHAAEYVHLRDPRGAGFEPESTTSHWKYDLGLAYYEEVRDSGANFFFEKLPVGEYTFKYRVRANMAGVFRVGPATVQSMYAPEFNAYSAGNILTIK